MLAAPAALAPIAELLGGAVDEVADLPAWVGGAGAARPTPAAAAALPREPDVAVNLHGRGPQSTALLRATGARRLIAFDAPPAVVAWREDEHEVARWCRLLAESGIPADPSALALERPPPAWLPAAVAPPHAAAPPSTVVHPGAASPARRWPLERWAAVARAEAAAGRTVLVTGSAGEAQLAAAVARLARLPAGAVLAGRTDLRGLLAVVAHAGRVVCGDTGVAHVATAFATPSVVLFGPVSPALWGPPERPVHRALWAGRAGDPHAERPDPGLLEIAPADVLAALAALPAPVAA